MHKPYGPYEKYFKRPIDLLCGLAAVLVFCWLYILLIILGFIFMRGNPFFTQERPGKNGKIFKLIKFRTMDNRRDKNGEYLPDEVRLNKYGRFLRKTSLDEIPEAFNIIKGDMSLIGPRPLLVQYLPLYSEKQKHRHDVRPGLSGYEYMMKNGCCIGGEQSGHIIFSKYASTGDGILTSLKIMEVMMARKKKLSELAEGFTVYPQVLTNVRVTDKKAAQDDADVQAAVKKVTEELGDTGRILVRESGTEPVVRVMVEAESEEICQKYVDMVVNVIKENGYVAG